MMLTQAALTRNIFTRILSRVAVISMALMLSACSTFGFIFERLDWFAIWRLNSMFDLSEQQEDQVRPDLIALQKWLRQEGFPAVITRLEGVMDRWEAGDAEAAYRYLVSSIADIKRLFLDEMQAGVIRFSLGLTEKNAEHYREYTQEKQEEWFEDTHSIEARIEEDIERLEKWFGHLQDAQVELIEKHASLAENERQIREENLASWRDAYLQAALARDAALLENWLADLSLFWTPEYTRLKQLNEAKRQAMLFELFPTLTEKQKRHFRQRVEGWIETLEDVLDD